MKQASLSHLILLNHFYHTILKVSPNPFFPPWYVEVTPHFPFYHLLIPSQLRNTEGRNTWGGCFSTTARGVTQSYSIIPYLVSALS